MHSLAVMFLFYLHLGIAVLLFVVSLPYFELLINFSYACWVCLYLSVLQDYYNNKSNSTTRSRVVRVPDESYCSMSCIKNTYIQIIGNITCQMRSTIPSRQERFPIVRDSRAELRCGPSLGAEARLHSLFVPRSTTGVHSRPVYAHLFICIPAQFTDPAYRINSHCFSVSHYSLDASNTYALPRDLL